MGTLNSRMIEPGYFDTVKLGGTTQYGQFHLGDFGVKFGPSEKGAKFEKKFYLKFDTTE